MSSFSLNYIVFHLVKNVWYIMKMVIGLDLNFGNVIKLDFGLDLNFELRFEFGSSLRILSVYNKYMNFCKEYALCTCQV